MFVIKRKRYDFRNDDKRLAKNGSWVLEDKFGEYTLGHSVQYLLDFLLYREYAHLPLVIEIQS